MRKTATAIAIGATIVFSPHSVLAQIQPQTVFEDVEDADLDELPDWFHDSERLSEMLGGKVAGEVENAKVIRRIQTPIKGLDAVVIKGTINAPDKIPYEEIFTLYMDKTNQYLVSGMMIDIKANREVGTMIARYVKGESADNPARALDVMSMGRLTAGGNKAGFTEPGTIFYVSDFAQEAARSNLINIHNLRNKLIKSGKKVHPFAVIPVSEGKDEMSSVASSMSFGYEALSSGDGYNKLIEFAAKGNAASWLQPMKIKGDPKLIQIVGLGVQHIDNNTSAALLARVNSLPLVYTTDGESAQWIPLPTSEKEWETILQNKD
jgi:hypothetical protein